MIPIRDDQPRFSTPYITYFLIGLNLVIFLLEASLTPENFNILLFQLGMVPANITAFLSGHGRLGAVGAFLPMLTSMFLHGSWMHVIGNMWFLWIFGDNIEDYLGHFKYLLFYLLSGLGAAFAQLVLNPGSRVPTVGASGAIAGSSGRIFPALSPRESVDLVPDSVSLLPAGVGHSGILVRHAIRKRRRDLTRQLQRNPRRCGVLGPRGRLSRRHHSDQDLSGASATVSLRNLVASRTSDLGRQTRTSDVRRRTVARF